MTIFIAIYLLVGLLFAICAWYYLRSEDSADNGDRNVSRISLYLTAILAWPVCVGMGFKNAKAGE